jgi:mannose-6-phosphate isomerase-like protein (cupin superfamily)
VTDKVTPTDEAAALTEFCPQKVVAAGNGQLLKVAKEIGSTRWHSHEDHDEPFLIVQGQLRGQLRCHNVDLGRGGLFVVPRGVENCPVAEEEARLLIIGTEATSTAAGGLLQGRTRPIADHKRGTRRRAALRRARTKGASR